MAHAKVARAHLVPRDVVVDSEHSDAGNERGELLGNVNADRRGAVIVHDDDVQLVQHDIVIGNDRFNLLGQNHRLPVDRHYQRQRLYHVWSSTSSGSTDSNRLNPSSSVRSKTFSKIMKWRA